MSLRIVRFEVAVVGIAYSFIPSANFSSCSPTCANLPKNYTNHYPAGKKAEHNHTCSKIQQRQQTNILVS